MVSPGVPWDLRELAARARGVPVMAELELGFRFVEGPVAAVRHQGQVDDDRGAQPC